MEIKVSALRDTLMLMQNVVPRKPKIDALKYVLLQDGKAIGTDLASMLILDLPQSDGGCLIPQRSALEVFRYVPGMNTVTIQQEGKIVRLKWDGGTSEFDVPEVNEFPGISDITMEAEGEISDGDIMVETLRTMLKYRSLEEAKAILTGVTISFGETMEIGAADSYRLAYQTLPLSYPVPIRVTMQAESAALFCSLWSKVPPPPVKGNTLIDTIMGKRPLSIGISKEVTGQRRMVIRFGKITIFSHLISGEAPNFASLIPGVPPIKVTVLAAEMERCVKRVSGIAKDGDGAVKISWNESKMTVQAKKDENSTTAEMSVVAASLISGETGRTAINSKYLLDYLAKKEGLVTIGITNDKSPVLFRYGKTPTVIMMPIIYQERR